MKKYVHGGDIYRHPGVTDFSANINPLGTPKKVIEAAAEEFGTDRSLSRCLSGEAEKSSGRV